MSDQERSVIEAAKLLVFRLNAEERWLGGELGQERCPCCTNYGYHSPDCELLALVNIVNDMNTNPAVYTMPTFTRETVKVFGKGKGGE